MPKNNGTIFSANGVKDNSSDIVRNTNNKRGGPLVTKKIPDRYMRTLTNHLSELPDIPEDMRMYIDRLRKTDELTKLARMSNDILFKCTTVFPFDLFPDTLIIDKTKVNFIFKEFFLSETVHSIMLKNVKDIQIEASLFFAKLIIVPDVYVGQPTNISYLSKSCALEARRIIQGLMLCSKEGIDLSDLDAKDIKSKIEIAGTAVETKFAE